MSLFLCATMRSILNFIYLFWSKLSLCLVGLVCFCIVKCKIELTICYQDLKEFTTLFKKGQLQHPIQDMMDSNL
jgi:hypothetical protein